MKIETLDVRDGKRKIIFEMKIDDSDKRQSMRRSVMVMVMAMENALN